MVKDLQKHQDMGLIAGHLDHASQAAGLYRTLAQGLTCEVNVLQNLALESEVMSLGVPSRMNRCGKE